MKSTLTAIAAVALIGIAACAPVELRPVDATAGAGAAKTATATQSGVSVEATTRAWQGEPRNLDTFLTPVLVRVTNASDRPLALRLDDIRLDGENGPTHAPIPVFELDATVMAELRTSSAGYTASPNLRSTAAGLDPETGRLAPERRFFDSFQSRPPRFAKIDLPTRDMIDRALPEGVLAPGGDIAGFVYFPEIASTGPLALRLDARAADGAEPFATVAIPFVAERR